jgi:23S rRNA (pseudouridine1915-N3)-methyltransferase
MKILILATGTIREAHLRALEAEYLGRFPAKIRPEVRELPEGKTAAQTAATQMTALAALPTPAYVVALDERGDLLTSPQWAAQLAKVAGQGVKTLVFLIGGADGLSDEVKNSCQAVWAFEA